MIVVVGSIKGGVGKSIIATNLAVLRARTGKKVLLVDSDEQNSTTTWANQRHHQNIKTTWTNIQLFGKAIFAEIPKLKADYDDIIIDVGGRETNSLRGSIAVADIFLAPFIPRSFDVWTVKNLCNVISEMRPANPSLRCFALTNQCLYKGSDNEEAEKILKNYQEIDGFAVKIGLRKAFFKASTYGLGVAELPKPDKKALEEITALYDFVYTKDISDVY